MKIGIIGSRNWDDYNLLMRKLTIEIEDWKISYPDENKILFLHHGRIGAENMVTEYVGKIEKFMRQKEVFVAEKAIRLNGKEQQAADFDMINSDIDKLIIFAKEPCGRSRAAVTIAEAINKPYLYIKG